MAHPLLCLCVQDLSSLRKGELDLLDKLILQTGLIFMFQMMLPDDLEFLGKALAFGDLDFTEQYREEVRPDGCDWVETQSLTISANRSRSDSTARTKTHTNSQTTQSHTGASIQEQVSAALSESWAEGESDSQSDGWSIGFNRSESRTESNGMTENEGESVQNSSSRQESTGRGMAQANGGGESRVVGTQHIVQAANQNRSTSESRSSGTSESQAHGTQRSRGQSFSESEASSDGLNFGFNGSDTTGTSRTNTFGLSTTAGQSAGRSWGESTGESHGESQGQTEGASQSEGDGISVSYQMTPLSRHKIISVPTGALARSVMDQIYSVMNQLVALPPQVVMVKCRGLGMPFRLRIHTIGDPHEELGLIRSPAWRAAELQRLLERVHAAHPFYFTPPERSERELEQQRVARFLHIESPLSITESIQCRDEVTHDAVSEEPLPHIVIARNPYGT